MTQNEIEIGACYRDPDDGEIVRVLGPADGPGWRVRTLVRGPGVPVGYVRDHNLRGWERVPDPTPAVREDEPTPAPAWGDAETARQERVDATARVMLAATLPRERRPGVGAEDYYVATYATGAYEVADVLEAARERYVAARRRRTA